MKARRILFIFFIIVIVLIILAVGMVFIFRGKEMPFINKVVTIPFVEKSTSELIQSTIASMTNLNTARYEIMANITWDLFGSTVTTESNIVFDGGYQEKLIGHLSTQHIIGMMGLNYITKIDGRLTSEKDLYSITELPALPFIEMENLKNKWYEYNSKNYNSDNLPRVDNNDSLTNSFKRLPDEIIKNQKMYHYLVNTNFDFIDNNDSQALERVINFFRDREVNLEIFIGQDDGFLHQLVIHGSNSDLPVLITVNLSNFNKDVVINKPTEAYPISSFITELFSDTNFVEIPLFGYLIGFSTEDFIDDVDQDGLYTVWEFLFGTDPQNSDTDGDGFSDLIELQNGFNPNGQGKLFE